MSCGTSTLEEKSEHIPTQPNNQYWHQGKAEITSYALSQARYGEIHKGTAVTVFVTEPFSRKKQVKLDNAQAAGDDAVEVLKLNLTKSFTTGIYPYSMMTSVFSPITDFDGESGKYEHALKVTTSSQEWCGHTFTQINKENDGYRVDEKSYFESEGDVISHFENAWLEDELWSCLRQNPKKLPVGEFDVLPSTMSLRLRHQPISTVKANARFEILKGHIKYHVEFEDNRKLIISYIDEAPFQIVGWTETYVSGSGPSATKLTTTATRLETKMLDYWNLNETEDILYREMLKLD